MYDSRAPILLALIGLLVIVGTLYAYYDVRILVLGYIFLVAAV